MTAMTSLSGTAQNPAQLTITAATAFATTTVGQPSSTSQTLTVKNIGDLNSGVPTVSVTGTNAGDFITTNTCAAALGPALTCTVTVTFMPTGTGTRTATLSVTASPGMTAMTSLSGTGQADAQLSLTAATAFAPTIVGGSPSASQTLTVKNGGAVTSGVPTVSVTGTNPGDFTTTNTCTAGLLTNGTCTVTVTFKPTGNGTRTATLSVTASPGGTATTSLTGTGQNQAQLTLTAATAFAPTIVGGAPSASQILTVKNIGDVNSGVPAVSVTGTNPGDFQTSNTCIAALGPSLTCTVTVTFVPTGNGTRSATLSVTASPGMTATTALSGTGQNQAKLTITPAAGSYTATQVLSTNTTPVTFTIKNTGDVQASALTVAIQGANPTDFIPTNGCATTLGAGLSCTVSVAFTPQASGTRGATLVVTGAPALSVSATLTGTGTNATGAACTANTDCTAGNCRDSICCPATCTLSCQGCATGVTGQANGTCALRTANPPGTQVCNNTCTNVQSTDAANCGSCGHSCLGGPCSAGVCQPAVIGRFTGEIDTLTAIDTTNLYGGAVAPTGSSLIPGFSLPKTPASIPATVAMVTQFPGVISFQISNLIGATSQALVWQVSGGNQGGARNEYYTCTPSNCLATTVQIVDVFTPCCIAGVYDAGTDRLLVQQSGPEVKFAPRAANQTLTSFSPPLNVAMGNGAAVSGGVFYGLGNDPNLFPNNGLLESTLANGLGVINLLAINATNFGFWPQSVGGNAIFLSGPDSRLYRVPLPNGVGQAAPPVLAGSTAMLQNNLFAADSTAVYWVDLAGQLNTCPSTGCPGTPTPVTNFGISSVGLTMDSQALYWINQTLSNGTVSVSSIVKLAR
jgi:hypothetical protein